MATDALTPDELAALDAYWRAANYLSVGQIYLLGNPLLREPLSAEHVKPRLLGHWGTTPGLNLIYAHLNRVINQLPGRRGNCSADDLALMHVPTFLVATGDKALPLPRTRAHTR